MAKRDLNFVADQEQIKCLLSNIYDLQKLRIAEGNRLVSNMYRRLGISKPNSEEDEEKENKRFIDVLTADYSRIADAVAERHVSIQSQIDAFNKDKKSALKAIYHETDYKLVESYMLLVKSEEEQTKVLDKYVKTHPMWNRFFSNIKGCGTLMSAVCLAYLDPYKARHSSSFIRYCGIDTVQDEDKDGNLLFIACNNYENVKKGRKVRQAVIYKDSDGVVYDGKVINNNELDDDGTPVIYGSNGQRLYKEFKYQDVVNKYTGETEEQGVFEDIETGEIYVGSVLRSEHGRRMGDTEMREYIDKNGEKKFKRGITYQPFLKSKLMGVLSTRLLMSKDPVYSAMYYDYRNRLDNRKKCKDYTAGHKNQMALRFMMKNFLKNLWVEWRLEEGLPVDNPYEVEFLGRNPHKYNAYQCFVAQNKNETMTLDEYLDSLEPVEDEEELED